jgi:predicted GNAT family N-acyltransferase
MTTPNILATSTSVDSAPRYSILVAATPDEIAAAQRLRHLVFADEMGAHLHTTVPGLDVDEFDSYCDHLLVREDGSGEIVASYRMLPPQQAAKVGRLYSDGEFELSAIGPLRDVIVETGRSCVHPDHRSGAVINLMWTASRGTCHLHGLPLAGRLRLGPGRRRRRVQRVGGRAEPAPVAAAAAGDAAGPVPARPPAHHRPARAARRGAAAAAGLPAAGRLDRW